MASEMPEVLDASVVLSDGILVETWEMPSVSGKFPVAGWRCKAFTYINHEFNEDKSWIYFAKDPISDEILINYHSKHGSSDWHSGKLRDLRPVPRRPLRLHLPAFSASRRGFFFFTFLILCLLLLSSVFCLF